MLRRLAILIGTPSADRRMLSYSTHNNCYMQFIFNGYNMTCNRKSCCIGHGRMGILRLRGAEGLIWPKCYT